MHISVDVLYILAFTNFFILIISAWAISRLSDVHFPDTTTSLVFGCAAAPLGGQLLRLLCEIMCVLRPKVDKCKKSAPCAATWQADDEAGGLDGGSTGRLRLAVHMVAHVLKLLPVSPLPPAPAPCRACVVRVREQI